MDLLVGIRFRGTKESLQKATEQLKGIMETQNTERLKINRIGIPKYIHNHLGQAQIARIEKEYNVNVTSNIKDRCIYLLHIH